MSPSQRIGCRFRIDNLERDLLGRAGMGAVDRATDTLTGELVAVEAIDPHVVGREPSRFQSAGQSGRHRPCARRAEALLCLTAEERRVPQIGRC